MASVSKLNAFLASVPANGGPSPINKLSNKNQKKALSPSSKLSVFTSEYSASSSRFARSPSSPPAFDLSIASTSTAAIEVSSSLPCSPLALAASVPSPAAPPPPVSLPVHASNQEDDEEQDHLNEANAMKRFASASFRRRISSSASYSASFRSGIPRIASLAIDESMIRHFNAVPIKTLVESGRTVLHKDNRKEADAEAEEEEEEEQQGNNRSTQSLYVNTHEVVQVFQNEELVDVASALEIITRATDIMMQEPNVLVLDAPFTICGDLHGQFQDLLGVFNAHGFPDDSCQEKYLFLGDYVDRGVGSCEILLLLLTLKAQLPTQIQLLRGNHECRSLSTFYGFRDECLMKYGPIVYNRLIKCFESMPIAARLRTSYGEFFCVHGGISPEIETLDEIDSIDRFVEPEPSGPLCDLLWSDPCKDPQQQEEWVSNDVRGCSYFFNKRVVCAFLDRNKLLAVIRAHELEQDGYRTLFVTTSLEKFRAISKALPAVITVFSAPEYCNTHQNLGATLRIPWENQKRLDFRQHRRDKKETEFCIDSENDAMLMFLKDHLPFLPLDFYELVGLCHAMKNERSGHESDSTGSTTKANSKSSATADSGKSQLKQPNDCTPETKELCNKDKLAVIKEDKEVLAATPNSTSSSENVRIVAALSKNNPVFAEDLRESKETSNNRPPKATNKVDEVSEATLTACNTLDGTGRDQQKLTRLKQGATSRPRRSLCHILQSLFGCARGPPPSPTDQKSAQSAKSDRSVPLKLQPANRSDLDKKTSTSYELSPGPEQNVPLAPRQTPSTSAWTPPTPQSVSPALPPLPAENDSKPYAELNTKDPASTSSSSKAGVRHDRNIKSSPLLDHRDSMLHLTHKNKLHQLKANFFTPSEWQALKLFFGLLDVKGNGVLSEESFSVLLAEQDNDAYATFEELSLLMEAMDANNDGDINAEDFLRFACRACLHWQKAGVSHSQLFQ